MKRFSIALKRLERKLQQAAPKPADVRSGWALMKGDVAYNTEHGPVVLRVVPCRGPRSGTKGYLIMPEGIEVGAFLNHQIGRLAPNRELSIDEHLDGVPNSYRIWSMYHVEPGESEQFEAVHRAVIDIIDGGVHAPSTT